MDVNLQGWDTANLLHFQLVNELIKQAKSTPKKFSYPADGTLDDGQKMTDIVFDDWRLVKGEGANLLLRCPFLSGRITKGEHTFDLESPAGAPAQLYVEMQVRLNFKFDESNTNELSVLKIDSEKSVTLRSSSENPQIDLPGQRVALIDDAGGGFSKAGNWAEVPNFGHGGNAWVATGSDGQSTATWTINALTVGAKYQIDITWLPGTDRATNASYVVRDGVNSAALFTGTVDQWNAPAGEPSEGNRPFSKLAVVTAQSTTLVVQLSNQGASGAIIADAVRFSLVPQLTLHSCRTVIEDWFNEHLSEFEHVFHKVVLNDVADIGAFQWLKPTATTYAVTNGLTDEASTFAVLCNTEGRTTGLAQQVPPGILDSMSDKVKQAGGNSAFVISAERFTSQILLKVATSLFPEGRFVIEPGGMVVTNAGDVAWKDFPLADGRKVDVTVTANGLRIQVVGKQIRLEFKKIWFYAPEWKQAGHEICEMSFTQVFYLTVVDVKDEQGKVIGKALLPIDHDPALGPQAATPNLEEVSFSAHLDDDAKRTQQIEQGVMIGLSVLGVLAFVGTAGKMIAADLKGARAVVAEGVVALEPLPGEGGAPPRRLPVPGVSSGYAAAGDAIGAEYAGVNDALYARPSTTYGVVGENGSLAPVRYIPPAGEGDYGRFNVTQRIPAPNPEPQPGVGAGGGPRPGFRARHAAGLIRLAIFDGVVGAGIAITAGCYFGLGKRSPDGKPSEASGLTSLLEQSFKKSEWPGLTEWELLDVQLQGSLIFYGKWKIS